jgi:hypothetical protein
VVPAKDDVTFKEPKGEAASPNRSDSKSDENECLNNPDLNHRFGFVDLPRLSISKAIPRDTVLVGAFIRTVNPRGRQLSWSPLGARLLLPYLMQMFYGSSRGPTTIQPAVPVMNPETSPANGIFQDGRWGDVGKSEHRPDAGSPTIKAARKWANSCKTIPAGAAMMAAAA